MIRDILADPNGQPSTMRLITLIMVVSIMGVWVYGSITAGGPIPLPEELLYLLLGQGGLKAAQRWAEERAKTASVSDLVTTIADRVVPRERPPAPPAPPPARSVTGGAS